MNSLKDAKAGFNYTVKWNASRSAGTFGIVPGQSVYLLSSHPNGIIIIVNERKVAISGDEAIKIKV